MLQSLGCPALLGIAASPVYGQQVSGQAVFVFGVDGLCIQLLPDIPGAVIGLLLQDIPVRAGDPGHPITAIINITESGAVVLYGVSLVKDTLLL